MFIFATDQELWIRELMSHIMDCDHYLIWKDILKFVYYFMILFFTIYIFKHFFIVSTMYSPRKCNNVVILSFIKFLNNYHIFYYDLIYH
jgi:hypothetical protein